MASYKRHLKFFFFCIAWIRLSKVNVPPNTLQVILGTGFYRSNDPTNSVKAQKEDRVLRIRPLSHQVHATMLQ